MYFDAPPYIFEFAKKLRSKMTEAESILWMELKERKIHGVKFRRQHPLAKYIADFYCHSLKVVIEVDGIYHEDELQKIHDQLRTEDLNDLGLTVIRFTNEQIQTNLNQVLNEIHERIQIISQAK